MIDVHTHAIPSFLSDALLAAGRSPSLARYPDWSEGLACEAMNRCGIRRAIVSVSAPGVHFGADRPARILAERFNDYCADLRERTDRRFGAFAALPLPDVEAACREACRALDDLALEGVGLFASYDLFFLGDGRLEPLMEELDKRAAIVFVHPAGHSSSRSLPLEFPLWMLEYPIDTMRAAVNLVMTGTTARYPNIRFILAHNGGALPYLAWRLAAAPQIDTRYAERSRDALRAEFAKFYYESAQSPGDEAFGSLLRVAPENHLLFGSDWPYCVVDVVEDMLATMDAASLLSPEQRFAIKEGNAAKLFS